MIMTLEEYRAKNTLALRSWRHRNREHYRTYQREYKRRYIRGGPNHRDSRISGISALL